MISLHLVRGSKSSYPRLFRLVKCDWKSNKLAVDIPLSRRSFGSFCASESSSVLHSVLRLYARRFGGAGGTTVFVFVSLLSGAETRKSRISLDNDKRENSNAISVLRSYCGKYLLYNGHKQLFLGSFQLPI